jgi:putative transcriptional regulator
MKNGLRDLRKARGLSQADLASAVEVTRQTINAVEADKYDPSLPLAYRLAAYFDLPVEQLFLNPYRDPAVQAAAADPDGGEHHDSH